MISHTTLKLKHGNSLHQRKNKLNYRSLSTINNKKINLSQNINSRLKTQSQSLKIQKSKVSQHKLSLLLNSFQQSKIKQVRTKRAESIKTPNQKFFNQDLIAEEIKYDKKTQNEWVNTVLPTMTAQALHQQNQLLKKQCNYLKQQNSKLSSKLIFERKQKQKLAKQVSLQNEYYNLYQRIDLFDSKGFDNENSNLKSKGKINNQFGFHPVNYMITGIKFRYEKLKSDYELKCKHVEEIMKLTNQTQIQEVLKENQILTQENKKLLQKILELEENILIDQQNKGQMIYNLQNGFRSNKYQNFSQYSPRSLTTLIQVKNQLQINNQKLSQQIATLKKRMQNLQDELHQKSSSIKNLHKTLNFVDNELYYKKKQNSKLKKVQKQIEVKLLSLGKQNVNIKKKCQQDIQNVRKLSEQIFFKEKQIFLKEIQEKNQKITKLQKQISYLSTLLKYWKPLQKDQKSSIRPLSSSKIDYQQLDESGHLRTSLLMVSNRKRTKTKISQHDKSAEDLKLNLKEPVLSLKPSEFEAIEITSSDEQYPNSTLRIPKTSRQKHSEKGYKARKINPLQIEYMKQRLRYRCLAERLTMDQIRKYFNYNGQNFLNLRKSQIVWRQKYITMKELQSILIQAPFVLTKQQAFKFSRFIVEDTSAQHVFCDENNQIQRDIVKSIIKAFLGDYQLSDIQKCKIQLESTLKNYGVNLRRALDALCQNKIVSPKKLFQLMQSLGIQVSLQLRNEIICRLYEKSGNRDINFLRYQMIFQPGFI